MAQRGAKLKPASLRLVDGTHRNTRHGDQGKLREAAESEAGDFGKPVMPTYFKGQAAWAWKRYIAPASWLDASREGIAITFCELWQEFRRDPPRFTAARHGQMRACLSELGLTDERNRNRSTNAKKEKDTAGFFGDD